ncbi:MAG TPA: hypothetical protein VF745_03450, partial [Steroidobacteraceae bacterium]
MGRLLDQADGLGLYARYLLGHLVSLDAGSRYVIFLASPAARGLFAGVRNVETCVLATRNRLIGDQVLVPRAARRLGVDLLFNPKFSLPLFCRVPGVFILQSSDWYVNPGNYPWWDNIYIRAMLPLYCRKARAILAILQAALDDLARHGLKLPRAAITHAGCPAIVPNTCAGPEVAGSAARLIDPHREEDLTQALLEVTGSQALRQQMRTAGLERSRRFGWPQAARRV